MSSRIARLPGLLLASLAAAAALAAATADGGGFRLGGDAERGAPLFLRKCKGCHGPEGRGDGALSTRLDPPPRDLTDVGRMSRYGEEELYLLIRDGGESAGLSSGMPAWSKLATDQEIRDLAAFVRTLSAPAE